MLYGIILAGGSGTRLWPLSTEQKPKQFLKLFSDFSMIVETSKRIKGRIPVNHQYILTGGSYAGIVREQFGESIHIMVEPEAKNTAPCILWAALKIQKTGGGTMAVLPSDHLIKDTTKFLTALDVAEKAAGQGAIVTFGILPERPETGYGYIEVPYGNYSLNNSAQKVLAFKEKPDYHTAQGYLEAGNFFWNSGMFVFDAEIMIEEFQKNCPQIYAAFEGIDVDNDAQVQKAFGQCSAISIDYAIMEKTKKGYCVPSSFEWSDVGSYLSVYQESRKDVNGNVGNPLAFDAKRCYTNAKKRVVIAGISDIIVAEGEDVILVADMKKSSEIGNIAKIFQEKK